jgi:hypothetical protein
MNNRLIREGRIGDKKEYAGNTAGSSVIIHKLVIIGGAAGLAMLSFRTARLVVSSLVLGLKGPVQKGEKVG